MCTLVIHKAKDLKIQEAETQTLGKGQVKVKIAAGGICGSDLHFYNHGGIGDAIRLKEPMMLGHEVSGYVTELGEGVEGLAICDLFAVSPSRPCGTCVYCAKVRQNHCENMRFYGSAIPSYSRRVSRAIGGRCRSMHES